MSDQQPRDQKSQGARRLGPEVPQVPGPISETQGSAAANQPAESNGARRLDIKAVRMEKKPDWCSNGLHDDTYFNAKCTNRWRGCSSSALFNAAVAVDAGKIHLYPPGPGDQTVSVTYGDKSTTCSMPLGVALEAVEFVMEPDVVYHLPVTGPEQVIVEGTEVTAITIHTNGWTSRPSNKRTPKDGQAKAGAAKGKAGKKQATKDVTKGTGTETAPDGTETPT